MLFLPFIPRHCLLNTFLPDSPFVCELTRTFPSGPFRISTPLSTAYERTCGSADAVILTGGLAHSKMLTEEIKRRVGFIAPVMLYSGENEMESLAHGAYRILKGDERARVFRYDQQQS